MIKNKNKGHSLRQSQIKALGWIYEKGSSASTFLSPENGRTLNFSVKGDSNNNKWEIQSHLHISIDNKTFMPYSSFRFFRNTSDKKYLFLIPDLSETAISAAKTYYIKHLNKLNTGNILNRMGIDTKLLESLVIAETENVNINGNYYVYTSDTDFSNKIISSEVQYLIADYLNKASSANNLPFIFISPELLEMKLNYTLEKTGDIRQFAELGMSLIKSIMY
ncbi:MAG: hypothetical protein JW997_05850 [Actinobacteria bacterium]|nr:hypothetical protein [Actinomycetota bacterium]